jgi:YidC/Oxa1 family membrane protein insertase
MDDSQAPRRIVFYSEGGAYTPFLRPVIDALGNTHDGVVCYLTSDAADATLLDPPSHVRPFFIGKGSARTYVLNHLQADVVAMTMPDLNTFHIKRSPRVGHYAYLHHTPLSTHMIYRRGAFDHFDSMLCVGPHHVAEMREWEALRKLQPKKLFEHGYPPLDTVIREAEGAPPLPPPADGRLNVLLAPSWGTEGLMETRAEEAVRILLEAGHFVRVRPHPRTRQIAGPVLDALKTKFTGHPGFDMDEDTKKFAALFASHVMVSDWSGVAMEFAFGLGRPVLFIDVPRRVNNPDYGQLKTLPLEIAYRSDVGRILVPDRLADMPTALDRLQADLGGFADRMRALRARHVFNIGESATRGAEILAGLLAG